MNFSFNNLIFDGVLSFFILIGLFDLFFNVTIFFFLNFLIESIFLFSNLLILSISGSLISSFGCSILFSLLNLVNLLSFSFSISSITKFCNSRFSANGKKLFPTFFFSLILSSSNSYKFSWSSYFPSQLIQA